MASVLPIHDRLIEPTKHFANLVIPGWENSEIALGDLASVIWRSTKKVERVEPASLDPQQITDHHSFSPAGREFGNQKGGPD
jgi:hypothetical protein